jgi:hypothetical protein
MDERKVSDSWAKIGTLPSIFKNFCCVPGSESEVLHWLAYEVSISGRCTAGVFAMLARPADTVDLDGWSVTTQQIAFLLQGCATQHWVAILLNRDA